MLRPVPSTVAVAWKCPSCTTRSGSTIRTFTTSTLRSETAPESPRYIDIPEPPQKTFPPRPRVKGTLPVPRDIFKSARGGPNKATPEYIERATQQAKATEPASSSAERSQNEYKQRMTDRRKQNFREGLLELQSRSNKALASSAARTLRKQEQRAQLLAKAEREDERLTNPTTTMLMQSLRREATLPDPNREERLVRMRANVEAKHAQQVEDRRDDLHTLYMHARSFITTESALDRRIEEVFTEDPANFHGGASIWQSNAPESIQQKLLIVNRSRKTEEDANWVVSATRDRVRQIAEELTGGKM